MTKRIEYDSFEKNGVTIPTSEVTVRELVLLGAPKNGNGDGDAFEDED